ncbi:uncharacterized protein LOC135842689 isoform X2 [Planococcus citri]
MQQTGRMKCPLGKCKCSSTCECSSLCKFTTNSIKELQRHKATHALPADPHYSYRKRKNKPNARLHLCHRVSRRNIALKAMRTRRKNEAQQKGSPVFGIADPGDSAVKSDEQQMKPQEDCDSYYSCSEDNDDTKAPTPPSAVPCSSIYSRAQIKIRKIDWSEQAKNNILNARLNEHNVNRCDEGDLLVTTATCSAMTTTTTTTGRPLARKTRRIRR